MKKFNFKKLLALVFSVSFMCTLFQIPVSIRANEKADNGVYIKIRYDREDANYDGWNLWAWERDENGADTNTKAVQFLSEDDEGKFAVIKTSTNTGKLGFILRRSEQGNEWAEKYFEDDVFIDLSEGDKEIVITHKEENRDFETREINKSFESLKVNFNYYRFNNDYDEWDIWGWTNGENGAGFPLSEETDYGKKAVLEFNNITEIDPKGVGFIVRKSDWSDKDIHSDRFINLAYANNKGEVSVYVVQGNEDIFYTESEAIKDNKITKAKIDSMNEINFSTNVKMPTNEMKDKIKLKENDEDIEFDASISEDLLSGTITTKNSIDLNNKYILEVDGFGTYNVTLGKVFASEEFEETFHYDGELGALYSAGSTEFKLWAPMASSVKLALYENGDYVNSPNSKEVIEMTKGDKGIWSVKVEKDLKGIYYDYLITNNGTEANVTDPYAKAVGVNGRRAMVLELDDTDPKGWDADKKPELIDAADSVIYEMHIRDFTIDESSNVKLEIRGKYDGMWQAGTTLPKNGDIKTGIDHLKELGITHIHLLPTFDHRSIDETNLDTPQFNWGYDPQNYNVPEGSYSKDPYKAELRIEEFKKMVLELHKAGIRVVMDVVYNHTGATVDSHLNLAVPDYYYRQNNNGGFSNGSGCGNEIASERSMVRKMIVDSVVYWANEYHIDGFRFDLMGLHDIETMKTVREELNKIDESILVYGEGWTGGDTPLPEEDRAIKNNTVKYDDMQIAAFSDDMRDGIKGHVFQSQTAGFVNGFDGLEELVKFGVVASTENGQVKLSASPAPYNGYGTSNWANQPYQTVNYASAHDNLTLWDKLQTTNPDATEEELKQMNKMSATLVLTSQGIPFFHGGEEMLRTKVNPDGSFNENSYNSPDSVNKVDWTRKETYNDIFEYYKGLIELRTSHKSFRMNTTDEVQNNLTFLEKDKNFKESNVVAYTLDGKEVKDDWSEIAVIFNANSEEVEVTLPKKDWEVVVDGKKAGTKSLKNIKGDKFKVPAMTSYVLVQEDSYKEKPQPPVDPPIDPEKPDPPIDPEKPEPPVEPEKPDPPVKPGTGGGNGGSLPDTGDVGIAVFAILGILALGGIVIVNKKMK